MGAPTTGAATMAASETAAQPAPAPVAVHTSHVWLVVATATLLAGIALWMARIDVGLQAMRADVTEIKAAVTQHVTLPAHPLAAYRLRALEKRVK